MGFAWLRSAPALPGMARRSLGKIGTRCRLMGMAAIAVLLHRLATTSHKGRLAFRNPRTKGAGLRLVPPVPTAVLICQNPDPMPPWFEGELETTARAMGEEMTLDFDLQETLDRA